MQRPPTLHPIWVRGDKEEVLAAVRHNGYVLQYAPSSLRLTREVVLVAVTQCGS